MRFEGFRIELERLAEGSFGGLRVGQPVAVPAGRSQPQLVHLPSVEVAVRGDFFDQAVELRPMSGYFGEALERIDQGQVARIRSHRIAKGL